MATITAIKGSLSLTGNAPIVSVPRIEPITIADVEQQIRFSVTGQESHIEHLITSVREMCEGITRRSLIVKQEILTLDFFPCNRGYVELPGPPLRSVESIKYLDTDNVEQTLPTAEYKVVFNSRKPEQPSYIIPAYNYSWPTALNESDSITINYTCGYGSIFNSVSNLYEVNEVPKAIKQWMLINIANLYEHPETIQVGTRIQMIEIPTLANNLIANYKIARW